MKIERTQPEQDKTYSTRQTSRLSRGVTKTIEDDAVSFETDEQRKDRENRQGYTPQKRTTDEQPAAGREIDIKA